MLVKILPACAKVIFFFFLVITRVTLAFTGVGLLVFLTSVIGLLPNGRFRPLFFSPLKLKLTQ